MLIISVIVWLALLLFFRKNRIWIFYYVWGAVGGTILLILFFKGSAVLLTMEQLTGLFVHQILSLLNIQSQLFDNAPGIILILLEIEKSWTTIVIDIECSGLLESCVFTGLLIFYPGYTTAVKLVYATAGLAGIFVINLARLIVIVAIMNAFGRDSIYLAHTVFGRMVFFGLVITLYWYIFTRPTLVKIREQKND